LIIKKKRVFLAGQRGQAGEWRQRRESGFVIAKMNQSYVL